MGDQTLEMKNRLVGALAELGLPDRVGIIGGVREKVANMLVDSARNMGEKEFRKTAESLINVILEASKSRV